MGFEEIDDQETVPISYLLLGIGVAYLIPSIFSLFNTFYI